MHTPNVAVRGDLPPATQAAVRERLGSLERTAGPVESARVTIRRVLPQAKRPYIADATVRFHGRLLAAHTAGRTSEEAAEAAAARLRQQVRRVVDADVARREDPLAVQAALGVLAPNRRHRPEAALKPPAQRRIVHLRTAPERAQATIEAAAQLLDLDLEFLLFRHVRTGEDVVVHRREDGRLGLLVPRGSALTDENDIVMAEESRYATPLHLDEARTEMDARDDRFLFFVDAADGRGKVLYLRHDGDYGLVEPA
jgi:ribosome-associated translation inhibitor RaiA